MSRKARTGRDPFAFSLGGMTTIASFTIAPIIADDKLRQSAKDRPKRAREERGPEPDHGNGYPRAA